MKFIDILYETLIREFRSPEQQFEIINLLLIDKALKSATVTERKAWYAAALLVRQIKSSRKVPTCEELNTIRASVNRCTRSKEPRTTGVLYSIEELELSEAAVRKFLHEHAWDGLPGFDPKEHKTASKRRIRRKQPDLDKYWTEGYKKDPIWKLLNPNSDSEEEEEVIQ